jgi:hypothetical protein
MRLCLKAGLAAIAVLGMAGSNASAAVVCNEEGDCWHVKGDPDYYKPEHKLYVHPDDWKWEEKEHHQWREHEGRGYWRSGVWIGL